MRKPKKQNLIDKKKLQHEMIQLTTPPRLEGVVKNAGINPVKKKKLKTKA